MDTGLNCLIFMFKVKNTHPRAYTLPDFNNLSITVLSMPAVCASTCEKACDYGNRRGEARVIPREFI